MHFGDHSPAHFHTEYGEYEALVEIETLSVLRGELPRRAMAIVLEWAALHRPTRLRGQSGLDTYGLSGKAPKDQASGGPCGAKRQNVIGFEER